MSIPGGEALCIVVVEVSMSKQKTLVYATWNT